MEECLACKMRGEGHPRKDWHTCEVFLDKITWEFTQHMAGKEKEVVIFEESKLPKQYKDLILGNLLREFDIAPTEIKARFFKELTIK